MMNYEEIRKVLAPCGLNCGKCMAFAEGDIKRTALELKRLLGAFDTYAQRFCSFNPVFENYPSFQKILDHFSGAGCRGCRNGECIHPNCGVATCYREKGVDFCFECDQFPCEKTNFDPHLKQRWINMNNQMKQKGVTAYYEATKESPRYL